MLAPDQYPKTKTAEGTLAKTPLPHLFVYTCERRLSGSLLVTHPEGAAGVIVFEEGAVSKAFTTDAAGVLGDVLLELGLAPEETVKAAMTKAADDAALETALVVMNVVPADMMAQALCVQVLRKIEHLFDMPAEAQFAYYEGFDALPHGRDVGIRFDPLALAWMCIRRNPAATHMAQALTRAAGASYRLPAHATPERFRFSESEMRVIDALKTKPMRVEALAEVGVSPQLARQVIYLLMITKQLELAGGGEARAASPVSSSQMPVAQSIPAAEVQPDDSVDAELLVEDVPPDADEEGEKDKDDSPPSSSKIDGALPTGALARVQLSARAVRRGPIAVEESAVAFDPRASVPPMPRRPPIAPPNDASPQPAAVAASTAPAAPSSAKPAVATPATIQGPTPQVPVAVTASAPAIPDPPQSRPSASDMLRHTEAAATAPRAPQPKVAAQPPASKGNAQPPASKGNAQPPASKGNAQPPSSSKMTAARPSQMMAAARLSQMLAAGRPGQEAAPADAGNNAEIFAARQRIVDRAAKIGKETFFDMLGVSREASKDEVQKAYFALAKLWHPDRLPAALADVKEACSTVFAHLSEAHQTLCDPEKRNDYMRLLKDGGATPDEQAQVLAIVQAATEFQKAQVHLKRGDYDQAEACCRRAYGADPNQADYLAMLAWLEATKPENQAPGPTQKRIEMLNKAIAVSEKCERAYFYRGMLLKRLDRMPEAVLSFKRAIELNPRNVDAAREVRLFELRKQQGKNADRPSGAPKSGAQSTEAAKALIGKLFRK